MSKKRRRPADLMSALDRAHEAATDLQIRSLLHELQVHSEEITVQNEQLLKAQGELEQARDRYADLYDFAPIGYLSLDSHSVIQEINLAGSTLLGRQRGLLIGMPFSSLIAPEHRDRLRDFLIRSQEVDTSVPPQTEVVIKGDDEHTVRLIARPLTNRADPITQLFTAMIDVTEERRLERERHAAYQREQKKTAELAREVGVRLAAEERVKALLERLVIVQEQERRRLALNLHDQLGQQLTALRLTMSALKEAPRDSPEADKRFELMENIVAQLDRDVDFLAWELRPAALDDVGLDAALKEFLRQWSWTQGVIADFHSSPPDAPRLPADIESHLYRIVQEALNNVSKHAGARHVSVLLDRRGDDVTLIVEDDGRGFDVDAMRRSSKDGGMGLVGMQERAASIGGQMQYESAPGKGTTLFVRVPMRTVSSSS